MLPEDTCGTQLILYSPEHLDRMHQGRRNASARFNELFCRRILTAIKTLKMEKCPITAKAIGIEIGDLSGAYRYLRKNPDFESLHHIQKRKNAKRRR